MTEDDDSARRKQPRVAAPVKIRFRNAGQFLVAYCVNLSRGGLFVATREPATVGAQVALELEIPGEREASRVDATVRWVRLESTEDGPPGMGLSFERVEDALGDSIDRTVARAQPLHIDLVGRTDRAWRHVESLVRSLVTCSTARHELELGVEALVGGADLVIVDADGDPDVAVELVTRIGRQSDPPPVVSLCGARAVAVRERLAVGSRVLPTPVDKYDLQSTVLAGLSNARALGER